jgi:hypothetical protein
MAGWNGGGGEGLEGEGPTIPSLTMASQAEIIRNSTNERSRSTVVWKKTNTTCAHWLLSVCSTGAGCLHLCMLSWPGLDCH